jgi:pimeloyl-ACP methyl ester carboxylesterase
MAAILSLLCASCGVSSPGEPQGAEPPATGAGGEAGSGGSGGGHADAPEIEWAACSLVTGDDDGRAECAAVTVPLRWEQPDGPSIELFVKRLRGTSTDGALWLLNGGPGGTGADFETFAEAVTENFPLDVYMPDHRGVGRSTRLGCAAEDDESDEGFTITDDEMPSCAASVVAEWGGGLAGFSTTNAARDLGFLIEATAAGAPAFVYGVSYGTQWAHRYLRLFPEQPAGVILDSIVHPELETNTLSRYDERFNDTGKQYLDLCGQDPFCASKLGADPWLTATGVLDAVYAGQHCPEFLQMGVERQSLRALFGALVFRYWEERPIVPALIYRLQRCAPQDVAAIQQLVAGLDAPSAPTETERLFGMLLGLNISLSERWPDPPPPVEEVEAYAEQALFSLDVSVRLAHAYDVWPRYAPDEHVGQWAESSVPMLMMQGTLDPATIHAAGSLVGDHFAGDHQTFVSLPGTPHGAFLSPTSAGVACGAALFASFLTNPQAPLDGSCVDLMLPVSFEGEPALAAAAFGTDDLWENEASSQPAGDQPAVDPVQYAQSVQRLRQLRTAHAIER